MQTEQVTLDIPVEGKAPYKHTYDKEVAESGADIQAISTKVANEKAKPDATDEEKEAARKAYTLKAFNYGHDLLTRQTQRGIGQKLAQGPEKAIAKAVANLVEQGMPEEQARELVIATRIAAGKPV